MSNQTINYRYILNSNKMYVVFTTAYILLVGVFCFVLLYEKDYTLLYLVLVTILGMGICILLHLFLGYTALAKSLSFTILHIMLSVAYVYFDYGPVSFLSIVLALLPSYSVLVTERKFHLPLQIFHFLFVLALYFFWAYNHFTTWDSLFQNRNALYITIITVFLGNMFSFHLDSIILLLEVQNEEILKTHKKLGVFLSDVSHQIKTPLNGIMGLQNLLEISDVEEDRAELFEILRHSSWNILRDMNNIMELSKIEGDMVSLFSEYFMPDEIVEDMQYLYSGNSYSLPKTISYKANGKTFLGDKMKVKLIIENIIENAFSNNSEAEVVMFMEEISEFVLHIVDPQKSGAKIIEKAAYNTDHDISRNSSSLGLYMSNSLANLLGGDFEIKEEASGTHYILRLPYNALTNKEVVSWKMQPKRKIKNVLLVEDNAISRKIISSHFIKRGFNISTSENGLEALEFVTQNYDDIDIIFMDIQMPIMDGTTATKKIRSWEYQNSNQMKPIIALTANTMFEDKMMCYSSGINYFLGKPFNPKKMELLLKKIEENRIL